MAMDLERHVGDADFAAKPTLIPEDARPHVRAFGRFVRLADGVADSPWLTREQKTARLQSLTAALDDEIPADWSEEAQAISAALIDSLRTTGITPQHTHHVLQAFHRDIGGKPCQTWGDLMVYCQFAAAPVGRYLIDIVGEDPAASGRASDALCDALRILRRLRDFRDPTVDSDRPCIPQQFLIDAKVTDFHLSAPKAKGQTRAVIDRVLDDVDRLLRDAGALPGATRNSGMRVYSKILLCRATKLAARFRDEDPLRRRVGLSGWDRRTCTISAVIGDALGRR